MKASDELINAVAVALEVTQTRLTDPAYAAMILELEGYPERLVLSALRRAYREVAPGRLTISEILKRIDDGRPAPEEAWGMCPKDEASSAYWTTEMRDAFFAAYPLLQQNDHVAARMAFKEKYQHLVQQARDARAEIEWVFSPGTDRAGRELVLLDAASKGRISLGGARALLPHHDEAVEARLLAIGNGTQGQLALPRSVPSAPAGWKRLGETLGVRKVKDRTT